MWSHPNTITPGSRLVLLLLLIMLALVLLLLLLLLCGVSHGLADNLHHPFLGLVTYVLLLTKIG